MALPAVRRHAAQHPFITEPPAITALLAHLGEPIALPTVAPVRGPPQWDLALAPVPDWVDTPRRDPVAGIVETNHVKAKRWVAVVACAVAMAGAAGGCEQSAAPGQSATRVPDVPYEPTPHHVVAEMLKLAQVGANDVVYDLGRGDGRIVIAAVKQLRARGVCVDIDPRRIRESRANAENAGVAQRIVFLNNDLFDTDIGDATVVTLFLWPSVNLKLRPKLWRELKPATRVVSYVHSMGEWTPQESRTVESARGPRKLFLWIVPADGERGASGRSG